MALLVIVTAKPMIYMDQKILGAACKKIDACFNDCL